MILKSFVMTLACLGLGVGVTALTAFLYGLFGGWGIISVFLVFAIIGGTAIFMTGEIEIKMFKDNLNEFEEAMKEKE